MNWFSGKITELFNANTVIKAKDNSYMELMSQSAGRFWKKLTCKIKASVTFGNIVFVNISSEKWKENLV